MLDRFDIAAQSIGWDILPCSALAGQIAIKPENPMDRRDRNNALTVAGFATGVVALGALITIMLAFG
jgi:hypothetical protein